MTADKIEAVLAQEEQLLKAQTAKTMMEYQRDNSVKNLRKWEAAKKALAQFESRQRLGERFASVDAAALWITAQGYVVTVRSVHNHSKRKDFPGRDKDGSYDKEQIAEYASKTWDNPHKVKDVDADDVDYKEELKKETHRSLKLKNDILEGKYYLKAAEDQRDALVLYGIKSAMLNAGAFIVQDLIALVGAELGADFAAAAGRINPELRARFNNSVLDMFDGMAKAGGVEVSNA